MDVEKGQLFIGFGAGEAKEPFIFDSADFTTHGVIVGMTGSGKTGLAVTILEEALLSGIPCFILDPKGDMGNLLLNFPDFAPSDFRPWVDEAEAERQGITPDQLATDTATSWKEGLAGAGITPERMQQLRDGSDMTIYTPGSGAGVGLNVLGSMKAPTLDWETQGELINDEIEAFVSSLLSLAGVESDPVSGRCPAPSTSSSAQSSRASGGKAATSTWPRWSDRCPSPRLESWACSMSTPSSRRRTGWLWR
jgi:hypothetical protein